MSTLRVKKSFLREVKPNDVMEELKADNYFDKVHREMIACVKDTLAYKQMKEVAIKHMFNTLTNTSGMPDAEAREEKKNQIASIGLLASQISSSISKTVSERLNQEAAITAKRALKRLSDKRLECSNALSNRGKKRKQNDGLSEISRRNNEQKKRFTEEDNESGVSLHGISDNSVTSSVHTSELSSFDDEIVVSSEDEKGVRKEKRIPFKTANKAYFDNGFSEIHSVIVHKKRNTDEASKVPKIEKTSLPDTSKRSSDSENGTSRPKRERKPNSKYSGEDMCS